MPTVTLICQRSEATEILDGWWEYYDVLYSTSEIGYKEKKLTTAEIARVGRHYAVEDHS